MAHPVRKISPRPEGEGAPVRYPRDPDLDPQLVWRGKDTADGRDLVVDTVPIYVQEKIDSRALIEDIRRRSERLRDERRGWGGAGADRPLDCAGLWPDADGGGDLEARLAFYRHETGWSNRMILGDSLLVMNSLAEKEALKGRVQTIFLDPPYGIAFASNWQPSTRSTQVRDRREGASFEPEVVKAFRDTWADGIHGYLAYLRDRLAVARALLKPSGSVFVQISDENLHLVRSILDETFGRENFVAVIPFRKKTMPFGTVFIEQMDDFLVWYAKDREAARHKFRRLYRLMNYGADSGFPYVQLPDGELVRARDLGAALPAELSARLAGSKSLEPSGEMESGKFAFGYRGKVYGHPKNGYGTTEAGMRRLAAAGRLVPAGSLLRYVLLASDKSAGDLTAPWQDTVGADDKRYVVQTNTKVVERCLLMTTDPGDLVLDPTCGSGTTAYVAEQWGRRWITVDTSRVALALARQRIMAARYPYYLLKDSAAGARKEGEFAGIPPAQGPFHERVRQGFVYERVPHITLKSIANNAEIDAIWEKWQGELEPLRERLNGALEQAWEEWEVPREAEEAWPAAAKEAHAAWWQARRARQEEIDAAIARNADTEFLYDRPYEDKSKVRVSGPFTVESLSPHRKLAPDEEDERGAAPPEGDDEFVRVVLDNLKKAGVQNTKKGERLAFTELKPWAGGRTVHAEGRYEESGRARRAAVTIGPEYGTVSWGLVRDAAKEAAELFDTLVVCGFAFEPQVNEESLARFGRLTVLKARMNQDLHMAERLRSTGAGNLFVVFGEPDIRVETLADGRVTVEILGIDVFDPTTGAVRASSVDDVACWFVDTDYDGESFFVRQAYFLGGNDPYRKLKTTLKAEIDEDAWASLYSAESRPFARPASGRIAVKVINHYGDEVLKVYEVP